ncbi:DUF4221 family protein [Pedobacter aquatilis]|uniref:DUF4221 family protein n=1 Tax=Pedobacter aquatilis TaxID=351343 RepID=UPI0025B472EC|nr:DUF4221 family protein [Pedobacter aquatilis]MDN3586844.1 DUF4221 family protein [Pedobacter aquatilis]
MNSYTNIGIAYDKYRNCYYRFLRFPSSTAGVMMCSVIVLDKDFNVLMEQKIDNNVYSVNQYFISEKGLAFFNHKLYQADNSKIVFDVFTIKI